MVWRILIDRWQHFSVRDACVMLAVWVLVTTIVTLHGQTFETLFARKMGCATDVRPRKQIPPSRWDEIMKDDFGDDPSEDELFSVLQRNFPNLPVAYWNRNQKIANRCEPIDCTDLPKLSDLEFSNNYWQMFRSSNGSFQLFGAYLDIRMMNLPVVRVLGMVDRLKPVEPYCQLWFEDNINPLVAKIVSRKYIWFKRWGHFRNGLFLPCIYTCPLPKGTLQSPPTAVSFVEKKCDRATNILRVIFEKPKKKKNFAVCVKGLDYYHVDVSVRLVEWIELITMLGADKIFFYKLHTHPNISKVLHFYEKNGKVQVFPTTLPLFHPNVPILQHHFLENRVWFKRKYEVVPYNDCLYRNLYSYRYIVLLDVDEIMVPLKHTTWTKLMQELEDITLPTKLKRNISFYSLRNVYFLDGVQQENSSVENIPEYMHVLRHVRRSRTYTQPGYYVKGFHNTENVVAVHNHFPRTCFGGCVFMSVDSTVARLQHYRSDCVTELKRNCFQFRNDTVIDTNIWRFKESLIKRVETVLKTLGYLPP